MPLHVTVNGREVTDPRVRGLIVAGGLIVAALVLLVVLSLLSLAVAIGLGLAAVAGVALAAARIRRLVAPGRRSLRDGDHREPAPPQLPPNDNPSER